MVKYVIKRILSAIPVIFIASTLIFFLIRFIPGDPALNLLGEDADPADVEALRERMGINDPIPVQYIKFLKGVFKGDWGTSLYDDNPVFENILKRMEPTILLTFYSTIVTVIIGVPIGIIAARKRKSCGLWLDFCQRDRYVRTRFLGQLDDDLLYWCSVRVAAGTGIYISC